jgi:hypothetical protein
MSILRARDVKEENGFRCHFRVGREVKGRRAFFPVGSNALLYGFDLNERAGRGRGRSGLTFVLETFQMKLDGLTDERKDLLPRFTRGNAPWKIGNIRPVGSGTFFNYDEVTHPHSLLFL